MRAVYSVLFWLFFVASSAVLFGVGCVVWLVTSPFDPNGRVQHMYSSAWAMLYFYVNPLWQVRIEGRKKLPWKGGAVFVSNHESIGDILVRYGASHSPHREWVYNHADIDGSKVVWARELDAEQNARLLTYFAERKVWLLEPDQAPIKLQPYSDHAGPVH